MRKKQYIVIFVVKKKRLLTHRRNQIMYSETMEMIPEDFMENWIMMICPKGKRCLVTSAGGYTIARSRGGRVVNKFQSRLPNGSKLHNSKEFCILDCIYDPVHWTYYVLDIMSWNGYSIFDCDTNFRHYWLQTKIVNSEFNKSDGENQFYKFIALKPVHLTDNFTQIIQNPKEYVKEHQKLDYEIDGLLFYHKEGHYKGGTTPLVCWVPNETISTLLLPQSE
jgi:snurportin-1